MRKPLLRIQDYLDSLGQAKIFSTLDLAQGYYQVAMHHRDQEKTAFTTPYGLYEFQSLPMGLSNSASTRTFQRLLQGSMNDLLFTIMLVYLDDKLIYSKDFPEHLDRLERVLKRLRELGLKLNPSKCKFGRREVEFLGHRISGEGVVTLEDKAAAIRDAPIPKTQTELRSFLGVGNYYRRFVKDFAKIAQPLNELVSTLNQQPAGKNIGKMIGQLWSVECDEAFTKLKRELTSTPLLGHPDFTLPFQLDCDGS